MCNKPLSTAAAMLGLRYSCGLLAIGRDIFWSALLSPICVFPPWDLCLTLRLALENHVFTFGNQKKIIHPKWYAMVASDIILYFWVKLTEMYQAIKVSANSDKIAI